MMEWVLDTHYAHLFNREVEADDSIMVYDAAESTLTPLMERLESEFAGLKVYSLPSMGEHGVRRHIELGARGDPASVAAALASMRVEVVTLGGRWEPRATT